MNIHENGRQIDTNGHEQTSGEMNPQTHALRILARDPALGHLTGDSLKLAEFMVLAGGDSPEVRRAKDVLIIANAYLSDGMRESLLDGSMVALHIAPRRNGTNGTK